jgi:Skp family chaperone for outer membrane proteins
MTLLVCLQNLEGEIERWREKYYTELEKRERELQKLQAKREMKYKELQDLSFMVGFKSESKSRLKKTQPLAQKHITANLSFLITLVFLGTRKTKL